MYQTTTLATMQARLADRVEGVPWWTAPESTNALNEALRVWNSLSGYFFSRITITLPANDHWLPIPGSIVERVRFQVGTRVISRGSLSSLRYGHPTWLSEFTNSGGVVPTSVRQWIPAGLSLVGIWPAPIVDTDFIIDGIAQTPILVNAGDFINIGDEEFSTLLGFALHLLAFKAPDQQFQQTEPLRKAFYQAAAERNTQFAASDFFRHFRGGDYQRSEQPQHRPTQEQAAGL